MRNTERHPGKRLAAFLLVLSMVLVLFPLGAFAAEGDTYQVTVSASAAEAPAGDTITLTATVTKNGQPLTDLAAEGLYLWWWTDIWAEGHTDGRDDAVYSNYDGNSGLSLTADVTLPSEGIYYIAAELQDSAYTRIDLAMTTLHGAGVSSGAGEDGGDTGDTAAPVNAPIDVAKVSGLPEDFIMGMDISSVISEFNSGVTYQDFDGNILDNITDFCCFLAECGVTHIRVRVWNDPYDADGNGYGGGSNDVSAAVKIAEGCAQAGLKLLVDFHCSDFWTDPSKQQAPKAWEGDTVEEKAQALGAFLTEALTEIRATGVDIAMAQVGNETTGGFIGETNVENMCALFSAGSAAIRAFDPAIQVVIHVTNPEKSTMTAWAANLASHQVDYDILATSYYPYWHGTLDNLKNQLQAVQNDYGKEVMVAETSYAFTLDDTDGHDNTVRVGSNDTGNAYPFSPQGQAGFLRDLIAAVHEAGGLGVYYWESAWITVGDTTGLEGGEYDARVEANRAIWERYGSGWASSFAAEYDPDDAGKWFGGSAVDNQAMFAADGTPLASIKVWSYVRTGAVSNTVTVESIALPVQAVEAGGTYTLPETVTVTYNKGIAEESVQWDTDDAAKINVNAPGTYVVNGTVTLDPCFEGAAYTGAPTASVTYTLTVKAPNLIDAGVAGFEENPNAFTIEGSGISAIPAPDDPKEGSYSMHWWKETAASGTVTLNEAILLSPGTYIFEAAAQGFAGDTVTLKILDVEGQVLSTGEPAQMAGWVVWQTPSVGFEITGQTQVRLQIEVNMQDGGWGTVDCLYLYQTGEAAPDPSEPDSTEPAAPEPPRSKGPMIVILLFVLLAAGGVVTGVLKYKGKG